MEEATITEESTVYRRVHTTSTQETVSMQLAIAAECRARREEKLSEREM